MDFISFVPLFNENAESGYTIVAYYSTVLRTQSNAETPSFKNSFAETEFKIV